MKKYKEFIKENVQNDELRLPETKVEIDPMDIVNKLENGEIEIDFRRPSDAKPMRKEYIESEMEVMARLLKGRTERYKQKNYDFMIRELPYDMDYHYNHPVTGEYCSYVLVSPNKITLATLENEDGDYYYRLLPIPETLIKGNFYTFQLDMPSGKMCFCGDWVRDIFVDKDEKDFENRYLNNYHRVEKDAIEHMEHFLKKGYFYVPEAFYPALSKKGDEYILYRSNYEFEDPNMGKVIKDNLHIDSDHTMVIIDGKLLDEKLNQNKEKYDKLDKFYKQYLKYCLNVEPGKYEIKFNWRFGVENEDDTLVYFIIKKV